MKSALAQLGIRVIRPTANSSPGSSWFLNMRLLHKSEERVAAFLPVRGSELITTTHAVVHLAR